MARIDKYLWSVRLSKTRSQATDLCKTNKVFIDDTPVKPSAEVKVGQKISLKKNTAIFTYEVIELLEKRIGAKLVANYIRDITPPEEVEKYKVYQNAQQQYRQHGSGRPTTKERRNLRKFREQ